MPWGMFTGLYDNISKGKPGSAAQDLSSLIGGPGLSLIVPVVTDGIDPFTNRKIWREGAPANEKMWATLKYLWSVAAPPFLTERGFAGKVMEAINKEKSLYSRDPDAPKITPLQSAGRALGMNVYPVDPVESQRTNLIFMKKEKEDLERFYDREIDIATKNKQFELVEKLKRDREIQLDRVKDKIKEYRARTDPVIQKIEDLEKE